MTELNNIETPALFKLKAWMSFDKKRRTKAFIARELDLGPSSVGLWIAGRTRPEPKYRKIIELLTEGSVLEDEWMTEEEREDIKLFIEKINQKDGSFSRKAG